MSTSIADDPRERVQPQASACSTRSTARGPVGARHRRVVRIARTGTNLPPDMQAATMRRTT
jgi:hypothetical protein